MTVPSRLIDGGIFTARPIEWSFECSYESSYDIAADEITMDSSPNTGYFSANGRFDLELRKVSKNDTSRDSFCEIFVKKREVNLRGQETRGQFE